MMGGANYPAVAVDVVSPQFCVSYPVDLSITRKLMTLEDGTFGVTDLNGNLLFRIRGKVFSLHDRRVLLDADGNPIITFQQKLLTAHRRWQVFRGESTDSKNMLFSVRKSSMIQFKTKLDVFMAANSKEDRCDFRIEGSWFERSCAIYAGDTNNVIAQMHKKHSAQSILLGKDTFCVTIYPNVDHAFIVALVVILEEINEDRSGED
ncbi:protein LURP-one-related 15-like [Salvia divinorum]|uniref:Protein LURP-one-related 15-like n=1 Tax=Salvia divinorum TaxID=28513 RepID=A0ABD1GMR7_SALDI